jgi:hypothetical protein
MKKTLLLLLSLMLACLAAAQNIDELLFPDEEKAPADDIVKVNFAKKDARKAMLFSAILPGAGQFYARKSGFTNYLFPVLELGMIGGIIYFDQQGDKKTGEFEHYATEEIVTQTFDYTVNGVDYQYTYTGPRYQRSYQELVQTVLMNVNANDIYDSSHFRLDDENTQHFYEDIGKYNKYIFGWGDWYHRFATDPTSGVGTFILGDPAYADAWVFTGSTDPQLIYKRHWSQNYTIEDYMNGDLSDPVDPSSAEASPWRETYIEMRKAANRQYSYSRYFAIGLAANHLAAAIDAYFVTNKVNRLSLTQNDVDFYYYTDMRDNRLTPSLGLRVSF